jgi:hypothetical protein
VLAPDGRGAALYWRPASAQGRTNRANIEQASSGRIDTVVALPSPTEHGPGQSLCPTREAGTILPKHASPSYRERAIFFGLSGMHSESVASSRYAGAGADGRVSGRASPSQPSMRRAPRGAGFNAAAVATGLPASDGRDTLYTLFFGRPCLKGCADFLAGGLASGADAVGSSTIAKGLLTASPFWSAATDRHCSTSCRRRALSDLCFVFAASAAHPSASVS